MLIKDTEKNFFFTGTAFYLGKVYMGNNEFLLQINTTALRQDGRIIIHKGIEIEEAMDYIYKCYKRHDRCCDLNDIVNSPELKMNERIRKLSPEELKAELKRFQDNQND